MKYLLLSLLTLSLVSCDTPSDPRPLAETKKSFESPETIGTLSDGREVKCIVRNMGDMELNHYIYFVGGTTTANILEKHGKSTKNRVVVEIDGVRYSPLENPEQ